MCGITGYLSVNPIEAIVKRMADSLAHRGPDDSGIWCDNHIALAHRRLSIIDLSPEGHQPMLSIDGRYVIVFNGEIYNHNELRKQLQHVDWRGSSDTEVILAAISAWGLEKALEKFVGMFAIALWDKKEQRLHLIRDRMGEKPLYYGWINNVFVFASELKALKQYPKFSNPINRNVVALYLRYSYVPQPFSIYQDIYKLPAGCMLSISQSDATSPPNNYLATVPYQKNSLQLKNWWALSEVVTSGQKNVITDKTQAINQLDGRLRKAIELQAQADVPLGAFLSGGIDSSLIVALMQSQSSIPVNTFTIGFKEPRYNEAEHALKIAKHLRTAHTELYVDINQALDVIGRLPELYDEPFADSSQIPTFLVCSQARKHLTVALSGDGGDELFCGYNRYFWVKRVWKKISWLPQPTRLLFARLIRVLPFHYWNTLYQFIENLLPSRFHVSLVSEKLHKLAELLVFAKDMESIFYTIISEWKQPTDIVLSAHEPSTFLTQTHHLDFKNIEDKMMYFDAKTYLVDDILVKVDRAAMGVSLETRAPFLDHNVVELAWQMPLSTKYHQGLGKYPLRELLYQHVPKELIERPKQGFSIPLAKWLREPLRHWAEELLDEELLYQQGFFNPQLIRKKWQQHLSGQQNWETNLWTILMFQSWLKNNS